MARPATLLAALVLACALAAGCGGDDGGSEGGKKTAGNRPDDTRPAKSVGPRIAGSVVQYADCGDWRKGTRREREATIEELRDQLTQQSQRDTASPLPDAKAYRILTKSCSQSYASSLRLYKMFAKAQGFAPLGE
jgi:hypothetical protein